MHTIQNTLYVMTPQAYAHLENSTVRIDVEREKKLQVPLHHVGGLVCFGNVMVSPALMHRLADEGKSLVLLDDSGRFKARLEGPVSGNILLPLKIRAVKRNGFIDYMKSVGKLGGQNKVPRLSNDRKLAADLEKFTE